MRNLLFFVSAISISACTLPPPEPIVSSFNGDSVEIQLQNVGLTSPNILNIARTAADEKAKEICKRGPNKKSEYVSTRTIATANAYVTHEARLYLCLR